MAVVTADLVELTLSKFLQMKEGQTGVFTGSLVFVFVRCDSYTQEKPIICLRDHCSIRTKNFPFRKVTLYDLDQNPIRAIEFLEKGNGDGYSPSGAFYIPIPALIQTLEEVDLEVQVDY